MSIFGKGILGLCPQRIGRGQRQFTVEDISRTEGIKRMRHNGISLTEIKNRPGRDQKKDSFQLYQITYLITGLPKW